MNNSGRPGPGPCNRAGAWATPKRPLPPCANRGSTWAISKAPVPWRGFWNSMGTALLLKLTGRTETSPPASPENRPAQEWEGAAQRRRWTFAVLTVLTTALASFLFAGVQPEYENPWLGYGQIALFALLSAWVVSGCLTGS